GRVEPRGAHREKVAPQRKARRMKGLEEMATLGDIARNGARTYPDAEAVVSRTLGSPTANSTIGLIALRTCWPSLALQQVTVSRFSQRTRTSTWKCMSGRRKL